jgi:hypothetical protein
MSSNNNLNPARRPQRLYLKREVHAMPKAKEALKATAWTLLPEDKQEVVVAAVRRELNRVM